MDSTFFLVPCYYEFTKSQFTCNLLDKLNGTAGRYLTHLSSMWAHMLKGESPISLLSTQIRKHGTSSNMVVAVAIVGIVGNNNSHFVSYSTRGLSNSLSLKLQIFKNIVWKLFDFCPFMRDFLIKMVGKIVSASCY